MKAVHTTRTIVEQMLQNEIITSKQNPIGVIGEDFYYEASQKDDIDSELEEALEEALIVKLEIAPEEFSNIKEQERAKHLVRQIEKKHQPAIDSKVDKEIQIQIGPMIDCMPDKMRETQRKTHVYHNTIMT